MWFILTSAILFLSFNNESTGTKVLQGFSNKTSWVDAQNHCVSLGGNLLLMNNDSIEALDRCQLTPEEMFWEGRYNTFSSWVIHVGCVQKVESVIESSHSLSYPGSVECGEYCRRNNYFGIELNTCFCLGSSFSFQAEEDIFCNNKCAKREEPCGGTGYLSVYKEVSSKEVKPRQDDLKPFDILCGLAECTSPQWNLYGYPCTRSLAGLCSDGNIISANVIWREAQNNCWQTSNKTLHGETLLDLMCAVNSTYENKPLWIQMRRDKVTRIVEGTSVEPESTCFGGTVNNGSFVSMEMVCSHKHIYVCVIDTDDPDCTACPLNNSDVIPPCPTTTALVSTAELVSTDTTDNLSSTMISSPTTQEKESESPPPQQSPAPQSDDDKTGAIVAGVVAGAVVLILVIGIALICAKRRTQKKKAEAARLKSLEELGIDNAGQEQDAKPEEATVSSIDISKHSTLLVRPVGQPSRQTDFEIKTNDDLKDSSAAAATSPADLEGSPSDVDNTDDIKNKPFIETATTDVINHDYESVDEELLNKDESLEYYEDTDKLKEVTVSKDRLNDAEKEDLDMQQNHWIPPGDHKEKETVAHEKCHTNDFPQKKTKNVSVITIGPLAQTDEVTQL